MAKVRKAVITAAGKGTRLYPASTTVQKEMFPLVDRDGLTKPTIQIIAEEALESGIEEIGIVIQPGDEANYRRHFSGISGDLLPSFKGKEWAITESKLIKRLQEVIAYIPQEKQEGYGHAVYCAKDWVGDEPFLLLLGDHLYISHTGKRCARQLIDIYEGYGKSVVALKRTPENKLHLFGTVNGTRVQDSPPVYNLTQIKEKPEIDYARGHLRIPSLPEGTYLCFFGMYVLAPAIFDCLGHHIVNNIRERGEIQLTGAQELLMQREGSYGCELMGDRYDMGVPFGYVETQIALALNGVNSEEILASLKGILKGSGVAGLGV